MIRLPNEFELEHWDKLVKTNPDGGHIYQSIIWGDYKKTNSWAPLRLIFSTDKKHQLLFQLLVKNVWPLGRLYYCPKGPGIFEGFKTDEANNKEFRQFTQEIKRYLTEIDMSALMLIVEPEILEGKIDLSDYEYEKYPRDLQFKATILVDITSEPEELLNNFKPKTRYNIRLAERKNVKITVMNPDSNNINLMYRMMKNVQQRSDAGYFLRPQKDFASYWQTLIKKGLGQLLFARHQGDILAGAFITCFGSRATYKDGGSFDLKRNLMAPHLLQYEAMKWAHRQAATSFDLMGVSPRKLQGKGHFMDSLFQFKSGFSDKVTEFIGCYYLPISPKAEKFLKYEHYYNRIDRQIFHRSFY